MNSAATRGLALDFASQIAPAGSIDIKRFFGGSALVRDGLQFGFVMKGILYLRVDNAMRTEFETDGSEPFRYGAAGREVTVRRYYAVPAHVIDDPALLCSYAERALHAASAPGHRRSEIRALTSFG
ncbi:competence protein TfoX [Rhizobium leguminosarum bv. trifolii CB782]|uniref:Competence protein TfoX n=1 Tax=Rhizobium hidalgonense TaxID=1538159 RepID=A0A2A6KGZ4_9HYPH|nr:TfoX/Sxy family protein [Rhizobium hidalgonense]AHG43873.1 competence protein TfoX [Rhizobium leguminosarum bv. trifolii CB782]EJC74455.1 regulator of competence-specific genes [Rhizobium leguminosarum bv. trifolii WSM2012]MDR9774089.1 TfoX/Sxy family protein [Rhizobium hidalgonense]MDR9804628.1 TfoX/Sxy family protein [Rhizobium hidalgonense]MDR9812153.1 TfoX/Sxy family protein [Rhizobium hidalgonense]